ncbi:DUF2993 domain-containing protein [Rhodococcus triatomae]|uniref:DUF2993 domain-containing protein n=1 Tax=Rhodococcus triatomae TaxID=300028 RepID=A0A1G8RP47_9NOCA|nr:DUF2993 domain-containing protein [Rhodococcus triatomae]QNG19888.1 DUF2993 domain-containing protein [Rhodococcus triatomae]QNG24197.1 DUF2993 domain-containing protein [Rhodococcus triatomae]SDJ18726.1 Protein of unknown function [Rhodococcus triatomae]
MAATRTDGKKRNRVLVVALVLVAVLVAAFAASELYLRRQVQSCMASQFESQLGSKVDVGLSWKPVLLQSIDKRVPYVTLESNDTSFGPAVGMDVQARVDDVHIEETPDSNGTIGSSTAEVRWSTAGILATMHQQPFGTLIGNVVSDPAAGTLTFSVGPGGLADLEVRPHISGDTIAVETVGAEILGFGLPTDLVDGVVQTLTESLQTYPLDMVPTSVEVTGDAIEISLEGGAYTMPAADPSDPAVQEQRDQLEGCGFLV